MHQDQQSEFQEESPQVEPESGYRPETITVEIDPTKLALVQAKSGGASWISTVAVFAIVNSALTFLDVNLRFIFSLGVADISAYIAQASESGGAKVLAIGVTLACAGAFLALAHFAKKGAAWAFIVAMVLYGLDGGIWFLVQDWLEIGCHVFAVFMMFKGLQASQTLKKLYPDEFK
ncbi:MAG: hypothetical protein KC800_06580 [Candidatus Eremiobacteraeota bacterium]|nr:hypothetical protein [Candidatus Eremiobacteraeota bacterium]